MESSTQVINIDGQNYTVPKAVADRMTMYADSLKQVTLAYNNLRAKSIKLFEAAKKMRRLQKEYFRNKLQDVLRASKVAEVELDLLLEDKDQKKEAQQAELFR